MPISACMKACLSPWEFPALKHLACRGDPCSVYYLHQEASEEVIFAATIVKASEVHSNW